MYIRKTYDEYQIQGNYGYDYGYECVTSEASYSEAKIQLKCYRENEPNIPFRIKKKRIKLEAK